MFFQKIIVTIGVYVAFGVPGAVEAHVPIIMEQDSLKDIAIIEDPDLSQAFYGELIGFPHTYEIRAIEPFTLFTQIMQPDIDSSQNNIGGIIIKERPQGGRVEEVTRLRPSDALWETSYEPFGGDTYRMGPYFEKELNPGVYRIEVSTANNLEKYVLVVGKREEMTLGYFELIGRIADVKVFFGKSKFRVVESPFVYVPLISIVVLIGIFSIHRRRRLRTLG